MLEERRYSEKDIQKIIGKALEIQRKKRIEEAESDRISGGSENSVQRDGFSTHELESTGKEIGLSQDLIISAAGLLYPSGKSQE